MATFVKQTTGYADIMKAVRTAHANNINPAIPVVSIEETLGSAEHPLSDPLSESTSRPVPHPLPTTLDLLGDNEIFADDNNEVDPSPGLESDPDSDEDHSGAHLVSNKRRGRGYILNLDYNVYMIHIIGIKQ
jgi:hypothetical protein